MKFKDFIITESDEQRWKTYISEVPMLSSAVKVLQRIESKGYVAYIVGGAVRDLILGEPMKDIDIATNCPIDILDTMFKTHDIGANRDFGVIVAVVDGHTLEIAQFRQDGEYLDGRRPESVKIVTSFKDDAARRDLTINALGIDKDGNIIDYFDGRKDIKNKIIKTVGNPKERFKEDYLRMMRAARFSSRLGFEVAPDTKQAAKELSHNVASIAPERIKDEIFKAAAQDGDKFARYLTELDDMDILEIILPEITKLKEFSHNPEHHPEGNVWSHTLAALKANKLSDPLVNLSILLHDTGKAKTMGSKAGNPTYYGHAEESINLVNDIADRLKMSNRERDTLIYAVGNHMRFHEILGMKPSKIAKLVNDDNWDVLVAVAKADEFARGAMRMSEKQFEETVDAAIAIKNKYGSKGLEKTMKLVDGHRVMQLTGLKPGKKLGEIIKITTDWIIDSGTDPSNSAAIDKYIQELSK